MFLLFIRLFFWVRVGHKELGALEEPETQEQSRDAAEEEGDGVIRPASQEGQQAQGDLPEGAQEYEQADRSHDDTEDIRCVHGIEPFNKARARAGFGPLFCFWLFSFSPCRKRLFALRPANLDVILPGGREIVKSINGDSGEKIRPDAGLGHARTPIDSHGGMEPRRRAGLWRACSLWLRGFV